MGTLIQSLDAFNETYIPEHLYFRLPQIARMTFAVGVALRSEHPMPMVLNGPAGSGKSLAGNIVLQAFRAKNLPQCLVNGFEDATYHAMLDKIIETEKILCPDVLNAEYKLNVIRQHLKSRPLLVVLDELDAMPRVERDKMLYNLMSLPKCQLVIIMRNPYLLFSSDERVRSRLNPEFIEFPAYTQDELVHILLGRVQRGLTDGCIEDVLLKKIAMLSQGDARVAITTLRNACLYAEREKASVVQEKHIPKNLLTDTTYQKQYRLTQLTEDHRMIYAIIERKKQIVSGALWKNYLLACKQKRRNPIAVRTFTSYLHQLHTLNLIYARRARLRGNVRVFSITDNPGGETQ